jgi:NAD(P)-dependent dehydrogenase (short-subunit alcohol dehydrogenase family)
MTTPRPAGVTGQRLANRIALVTGGAAGIGLVIAQTLASEGARVIIADINGEGAERAAAALRDAGFPAAANACDVSRGQDVTQLFRLIAAEHGRLDVVVNNAGINVRSDFRHLTDADWVKIREVNLDGVVRIARDAFEPLRASTRGVLINVASIMAQRGLRQLAAYSATKGAVSALTRALAVEYAPFGIRVNTVSPGFVETALTERVLRNPAIAKALIDQTPLRRFGTGEDIAHAIAFLASDQAAYITGVDLPVDGGMSVAL